MQDKEILEKLLNDEKELSSLLNTFACECANVKIKNLFLNLLDTTQANQQKVFNMMQNNGYYKVKNATAEQVKQVHKKFAKEKFFMYLFYIKNLPKKNLCRNQRRKDEINLHSSLLFYFF